MNIIGIICEYNPFHKGHAYQIAAAKEKFADSAVVCIMSGNFVQRGDAAVFRKQARVKAALDNGADLVIELPLPWATASAGRFAEGAVHILSALGLPAFLSFGSESGDTDALISVAEALISEEGNAAVRKYLESGMSYAEALQKAAEEILGKGAEALKSPNNLLGIEYIKAIKSLGADITPFAVPRKGPDHNCKDSSEGFASATAIRSMLAGDGDIREFVPQSAYSVYEEEMANGLAPVTLPEGAVLYRLRTMSDGEYDALPDNSEGLANRLAKFARSENNLEDILTKTKTKRYALSRIRRMALSAYLGVTSEMSAALPPYIRVLGANSVGQSVLREIKNTATLPIITKPAAARDLDGFAGEVFALEAKATDIYSLGMPGRPLPGGSEWTTSPIIIK